MNIPAKPTSAPVVHEYADDGLGWTSDDDELARKDRDHSGVHIDFSAFDDAEPNTDIDALFAELEKPEPTVDPEYDDRIADEKMADEVDPNEWSYIDDPDFYDGSYDKDDLLDASDGAERLHELHPETTVKRFYDLLKSGEIEAPGED